ncbi:MAG: hypothetical protein MUF31_09105 [Akkermansiaceae bacterium]|jgi:hypothetical protein|nr:hypothetical protein [Akkermansiaceae bacterium]
MSREDSELRVCWVYENWFNERSDDLHEGLDEWANPPKKDVTCPCTVDSRSLTTRAHLSPDQVNEKSAQQTERDGPHGETGAVMDFKLAHDARDVGFHGIF